MGGKILDKINHLNTKKNFQCIKERPTVLASEAVDPKDKHLRTPTVPSNKNE